MFSFALKYANIMLDHARVQQVEWNPDQCF